MSADVRTYVLEGVAVWVKRFNGHGPSCPCLICADTRKFFGWPALQPATPVRRDARTA